MAKIYSRTPRYYDGTKITTHHMVDLIPQVLAQIGNIYQQHPDLIIGEWPSIIGLRLAQMAQAVSFIEGILVVKVKNSTLHSLLSQNEKPRLLRLLRGKFPNVEIKNISFRIG